MRLTIHACLPTWRMRVNPNSSNSSTVPLKRKRPWASRPLVVSEIASTSPPPAAAISASARSSSSWTVRNPGWRAQPEKSVPS